MVCHVSLFNTNALQDHTTNKFHLNLSLIYYDPEGSHNIENYNKSFIFNVINNE